MRAPALLTRRAPEDEILERLVLPRFVETAVKAIVVASLVLVYVSTLSVDSGGGDGNGGAGGGGGGGGGDLGADLLEVTLLVVPCFAPWFLWMGGLIASRRVLAMLVLLPVVAVGGGLVLGVESADVATGFLLNLTIVMWILFAFAPRRDLAQVVLASYVAFVWFGLALGDLIDWMLWMVVLTFSAVALAGVRVGAIEIAKAQQRLAQAQAAEARRQIARDVHDVVAHTLAVTMLHLTAARMAVGRGEAEDATDALDEAERQGLASLTDVRRVLQVLDEQAEPPPDLGGIPTLVGKYRSAGLPVVLAVSGPVDTVTAAASITTYRVVQEALANAARHGEGSAAVELQVEDGAVELVVTNPTRSSERSPPIGNGVRGMHERVEAVGGRITVGRVGAGWRVHARLPIEHYDRPGARRTTEARTDDPSVVGG